jgi:hypothetical protein
LVGANQAITHPDVSIEYTTDDSLDVAATTSAVFFTNPYRYYASTANVLCGAINLCSIKAAGCITAYTNPHLIINAVTGEVTAMKNVDAGYVDEVCIKC